MNADGILYIANFFCKEAKLDGIHIDKALEFISWLCNRNISKEEVEGWLDQNDSILDSFDVLSLSDYTRDNYRHYIYNFKYINDLPYYTIISLDRSPNNEIILDIKKEGFLKGYKNIPNFYIFFAEDSKFKEEPVSKEMVKYNFLDEILKPIAARELGFNDLVGFKENKELFINTNKTNIDKLISSFSNPPKLLGKGDDGVAYSIDSNLVLKIFTDQFSYLKAKESFETLHKNPDLGKNEAMIYDYGILGNFLNQSIYYIILEKMKVLDTDMQRHLAPIIGAIGTYVRKNKETFNQISKELYNTKNNSKIKSYINIESEKIKNYIIKNYKDQIKNIEDSVDLNKDWLKNLADEIIFKYLTNRGDLHLGNIGITNYGKFIYFDPAHENWENDLNVPSRDDIDFLQRDNIQPDTFKNLFI